jgi:hypothetical protein
VVENINNNEHVDLEHIYVQYQNLFQLENISEIVDRQNPVLVSN